ncbi:MAG: ABC transporter permease [Deltaproteobacteria bacterium]|nr:ABC transporter permease [Deltaproteobacteria bacterium]
MSMYPLILAFRSLGRNRRRTLVTSGATAFAGFLMIVYSALVAGMMRTMERSVIAFEVGDVQLHARGYRDDPDLYRRIDNATALADRLSKKESGVYAAPRLYGGALAAAHEASAGVEVRGIDLLREPRVTEIASAVWKGQWLSGEDPRGIVLGKKLARSLGVAIGDEVVLLGQAADGSMANDAYRVRGVLKSISERADQAGLFVTEAAFRELFTLPEGHHEIALTRGHATLETVESIALAETRGLPIEVATWRTIQPAIAKMIDNSMAGRVIMLLIFYSAIAMVILNATLMSVFERIREFGIMKAIGVGPWYIGRIVFFEVVLQSCFASLVAIVAGLPLALFLERHGWDLTALAGDMNIAGIAWEPVWYAFVDFETVALPILFLLVVVSVASLYPGVKAAIISPKEAIYQR